MASAGVLGLASAATPGVVVVAFWRCGVGGPMAGVTTKEAVPTPPSVILAIEIEPRGTKLLTNVQTTGWPLRMSTGNGLAVDRFAPLQLTWRRCQRPSGDVGFCSAIT